MLALGDATSTVPSRLFDPSRAKTLAGIVTDSTSMTGAACASETVTRRSLKPENQPRDHDSISTLPLSRLFTLASAMRRANPSERMLGSSATRISTAATTAATIHRQRLLLRPFPAGAAVGVSGVPFTVSSVIAYPSKENRSTRSCPSCRGRSLCYVRPMSPSRKKGMPGNAHCPGAHLSLKRTAVKGHNYR